MAKSTGSAGSSGLIEFYGTECHFCIQMEPLLQQLEQETGLKVKKIEVWHNAKNAELMKGYDRGFCGGVPFFFNEKSKEWICGAADYDEFKAWALKGQKSKGKKK